MGEPHYSMGITSDMYPRALAAQRPEHWLNGLPFLIRHPCRRMDRTMLSVFQWIVSSAASPTLREIIVFLRGQIAMMRFGIRHPSLGNPISMLIYLP